MCCIKKSQQYWTFCQGFNIFEIRNYKKKNHHPKIIFCWLFKYFYCFLNPDVFLTWAAHSFCLAVLLPLAPFFSDWLTAAPNCSFWWAKTRFNLLNTFHNCHRDFCPLLAFPSLNAWGDKSLPQLLKENSSFVYLSWRSSVIDLLPYHKGIVCGHINDVVEEYQGPVCSHSFAAVHPNNLVKVVEPHFISVVVKDDGWFPPLLTIHWQSQSTTQKLSVEMITWKELYKELWQQFPSCAKS